MGEHFQSLMGEKQQTTASFAWFYLHLNTFIDTAGQSGLLIIKTTSLSADFRASPNGLSFFENASPSTVSGNSYLSGTIGLA